MVFEVQNRHYIQIKLLFSSHHIELFVFGNCVRKVRDSVYHIACMITFLISYKICTGVEARCYRACA
jgi:hypothetical protein